MTLPSHMSRDQFIARFGAIYEHSPHFAAMLFDARKVSDDPEALLAAFRQIIAEAGEDAQLCLIRAHPDLADRVAMSRESVGEQSGAGLTACSPDEFAAFQQLNADYKTRFGFPFIVAVRGLSRGDILSEFRRRVGHDRATEFAAALEQIHRIAAFRLHDLFGT